MNVGSSVDGGKDVQRCAMALKDSNSNEEPCAGTGQVYIEFLPGHVSLGLAEKHRIHGTWLKNLIDETGPLTTVRLSQFYRLIEHQTELSGLDQRRWTTFR